MKMGLRLLIIASALTSTQITASNIQYQPSGLEAQCSLRDATVKMRGKWRTVDSVITLYANQGSVLKGEFLQSQSRKFIRSKLDYKYAFDGQSFFICKDDMNCVGVTGTPAEYRNGIRAMLDSNFLRGLLTCYVV